MVISVATPTSCCLICISRSIPDTLLLIERLSTATPTDLHPHVTGRRCGNQATLLFIRLTLTHRIYHQESFTVVVEHEPFNDQLYKTSGRYRWAKTDIGLQAASSAAWDTACITSIRWTKTHSDVLKPTQPNRTCCMWLMFHTYLRLKVLKVYFKIYKWE